MVQAWKTNRSRCCDPNWRNCSCGSVTASSSLFPPLTQNCYLGLLRPLKGSLLSVCWLVVCGIIRWFLQHSALLLGAFEAFWRQSIERVKADATYYHWEYVASDGFARVQSFPWVDGGQQGDFPGRWSLHHLSCLTKTWHLESVRTLTTRRMEHDEAPCDCGQREGMSWRGNW